MPPEPRPTPPRPSKWRRLWRRRLRRRPLLPFLLAAFLVADLLVVVIDFDASGNATLAPLLLGVVVGQVSLVGVWVASRARGGFFRLILAFPGVALLTTPLVLTLPDPSLVVMTFVAAFLLASSAVAAVIFAIRSRLRHEMKPRMRKRFKIGMLMLVMTITPFVIYALQNGRWEIFTDSKVLLSVAFELLALALLLGLALLIKSNGLLATIYSVSALGLIIAQAASDRTGAGILSFLYYVGYLASVGGGLVVLRLGRRAYSGRASDTDEPESPSEPIRTSIDVTA